MSKAKAKRSSKQSKKLAQVMRELEKSTRPVASTKAMSTCKKVYCI